MKLPTEELQYLEISFWKDYNEHLIFKKNLIKERRYLNKIQKKNEIISKQRAES